MKRASIHRLKPRKPVSGVRLTFIDQLRYGGRSAGWRRGLSAVRVRLYRLRGRAFLGRRFAGLSALAARPRLGRLIVVVAFVGAVGVAAAMSLPSSGEPHQAAQTAPSAASRVISGDGLQFNAAAGWAATRDAPPIPGVESPTRLVLAERRSRMRLIAAQLSASSPTLLPAALVRDLSAPPGKPERVRLGGGLAAYYYADLSLVNVSGRLDVYVAPTSEGVATVACLGEAGLTPAQDECWSIASTLRLTSAQAVSLNRDAGFWLRVAPEIRAVDTAREDARRQLARVTTPGQQSDALADVSLAYRRAADALEPLGGHSRRSLDVVAQLNTNAATYRRLSGALRVQDEAALARNRQTAVDGELRLKRLIEAQR